MKGYSILLAGNELLHDVYTQSPYFVKTKATATRMLNKGLADWLKPGAKVVRVRVCLRTGTLKVHSC